MPAGPGALSRFPCRMGVHSLTATDTVSGITSAPSAVMSVTVDTVAPAAPSITSFSTDSGKKGDGITNDNTLTLSGTAEANTTVKVFDGTTLLGSVVANGSGAWTYTTAALAKGAAQPDRHGHRCGRQYRCGLGGLERSQLIRERPNAPSLRATRLSVRIGDADGHRRSQQHGECVRRRDAALEQRQRTAGGAWNYTTSPLSDGPHAFTATATDAAGNTSLASQALDPIVGGTVIEANGVISLTQVGDQYYLDRQHGCGPASLKIHGADYVAGQCRHAGSGRRLPRRRRRPDMRLPGSHGSRSVYGVDHRQQRQLHLEYRRCVG